MGKTKIQYAYCGYCKKEITNPRKRQLDSMEKTIWVIIFLATLGIGVIPFLIYNKYLRKSDSCPTCLSILKFSADPFEKPKKSEDMTPKEKVMEKAGAETPKKEPEIKETEEKEEEGIFCPFCGEQLSEKVATCPICKTAIKF